MSDDLAPIIQTSRNSSLGDRIREIASQLRQENEVQIKATSRILGAAAQIAQNHDQLVDEVVEMVQEDLNQSISAQFSEPYTAAKLQEQFKTLKDAKAHFGIKASSWVALVSKLNQSISSSPAVSHGQDPIIPRLEVIEQEVKAVRDDIKQMLNLLSLVLQKLEQ